MKLITIYVGNEKVELEVFGNTLETVIVAKINGNKVFTESYSTSLTVFEILEHVRKEIIDTIEQCETVAGKRR
jgi:hypothetical protein